MGARRNEPSRPGVSAAILDRVERLGNRLPHPIALFSLLAAAVLVFSSIASRLELSATHPVTGKRVLAADLLDREGIQNVITKAVSNFTGFAPLGTVLTAMIGVGIAERAGLFAAALKGLVASVPRWLLTAALVFAGINASLAVDAGYVVLVPLGAVLFSQVGRHPLAGLAAAFAGVSAGFSANVFLTPVDPLLAGLTQEAARLYDPKYTVPVSGNYYFMLGSAFWLTAVGVWVNHRFVEPRVGRPAAAEGHSTALATAERRGLKAAALALALEIAFLLAATLPSGGLLRDAKGGLDPLLQGMVTLMAVGFALLGLAYGAAAGTIRGHRDLGRMMEETMAAMGSYVALAFAASQFVAYFGWSNLGLIFAIHGARGLEMTGLSGVLLLVLFIFVCSLLDLLMASASAKWAAIGPVFVPMLMIMGYAPEVTQAAYRVGDSFANIVTPLMPYMPLVIAFAQKYDPKIGLGTLLALMLPYSVAFGIAWTLLFALWLALGIPFGPGAPLSYPPA